MATTMDFVEEADWFGITCESCHIVDENGIAGELAWLNVATGEYEEINYPNELCGKCHANTSGDTHMNGLNAIMLDKVTCMACHDADEMEVGPHPDEAEGGVFVTIVSSVGRAGPTTEYVKSHSIQWEVSCDRCHFEGNAWELTVLTADGQVPEPTPEPTAAGGS